MLPKLLVFTITLICITGCFALRAEPLMLPRSGLSDETVIVSSGKSISTIIYPTDDPAYRKIAVDVQKAMQDKTRVLVPSMAAGKSVTGKFTLRKDLMPRNLILLGNVNNNPALVRLSANYLVYSTRKWPGADGFEIRTITNPYGTRNNYILIGGSNSAGVKAAADEMVASLKVGDSGKSLVLPRLLKIVVDGKDQAALGVIGDQNPIADSMIEMYRFAGICEAYNTSGSPARLEAVRQMLQLYFKEGRTPAAADYGTESAVRALDMVDSFCMTDAENTEMDNRLLQWELRVARDKPYWNQLGRSWSFGGHQACGSMSFYVIANYLLKNGNPNAEAKAFLEESLAQSRVFLHYLSTSFKDNEKDIGWETWTSLTVPPRYALAEDDMWFFDQGVAEDVLKRAFYADHGFTAAGLLAFIHNDGRFKTLNSTGESLAGWAHVLNGVSYVTPDALKPAVPDMLIGARTMRASTTDWEHAYVGSRPRNDNWYTRVPYDRCFHVAGFASGVTKDDEFLVMNGWDSQNMPGEANCIRIFRRFGRDFLKRADGDDQRKPRPGRFYQNSLVVENGKLNDPAPCGSELMGKFDSANSGAVWSRLSGYNGTDWDRAIFWRKGGFFAVIDTCTAKAAGEFVFTDQWWNWDSPKLENGVWSAQTDKGTFSLVMDDAGTADSRQYWRYGPYQLSQKKRAKLGKGGRVSFHNAFYVDSLSVPTQYGVRKLSDSAVLIKGKLNGRDDIALVGFGKGYSGRGLIVSGKLFMLSPEGFSSSGSGSVTIEGQRLSGKFSAQEAQIVKAALTALWDDRNAVNEAKTLDLRATEGKDGASAALTPGRVLIQGVQFTVGRDGTVTWDLGKPTHVSSIEGYRPTKGSTTVQCSDDGFKSDVRTFNIPPQASLEWVAYQYGFSAGLGVGVLPIDATARYWRITNSVKPEYGFWIHKSWHNQDWNVTGHNQELFGRPFYQNVTFRGDQPRVDIQRILTADLDNDGWEETLVATSTNDGYMMFRESQRVSSPELRVAKPYELVLLAANGAPLWSRAFESPVLSIVCGDVDGDGKKEIVVSHFDNSVTCYSFSGDVVYTIDLMSKGNRAMPAYSLSMYPQEGGKLGLITGQYHGVTRFDSDGKLVKAAEESPGFYLDASLPVCTDFTGDGKPDIVMRDNLWGIVSLIDGESLDSLATASTSFPGRGLAVIPWKMAGIASPVLVLAREGVTCIQWNVKSATESAGGGALVVSGGSKNLFSLPISPITGWTAADLNEDGLDELVIGTLYGSVYVVSNDGRILFSTLAGVEVNDVAVLRGADGPAQIAVATPAGIAYYDVPLKLLKNQPLPGNCVKLQSFKSGGEKRAWAFLEDGSIVAVEAQ